MPGSRTTAVVVVEDDTSMGLALQRILRLGGYATTIYRSAEALLEAGRPRDAVCMIIDVQLPGIDGFALHQRLTASGACPPVIFITAINPVEAEARATGCGAAAFLAKPFSGRMLLGTIGRLLASERR